MLLNGLYPITDTALLQNRLIDSVRKVLAGGARIIQYRDKTKDHGRRINEARQLKKLCHEYDALLIVNDDINLALESKADGVHIGADDDSIEQARTMLGADKIIGVSCYNQLELAVKAEQQGADYVAFGRFFASSVKPDAVQADIDLLIQARKKLSVPITAIGGITLQNAPELIAAGADLLAVINGVFAQKAIQSTAQEFTSLC